jgi:hypothetical protein
MVLFSRNYRPLTSGFKPASLDLGLKMIRALINKFLDSKKRETKPRDYEWERFQQTAKEQFVRLNKKGINIPVMTL